MSESQVGGDGRAGEKKVPILVKLEASDPLDLARAIVTAAIKCRDNTDETEIPFVVGIRHIEMTYAAQVWSAISAAPRPCGVRMEPVPDHRNPERAVLLFFREATEGRSDGATKG